MASRAQDVAIYLTHQFQYAWECFGFFDLQRLMYLAQGWHLAGGRGVLFEESIGAHKAAPLTFSIKGLLPMDEMLPHPVLEPEDEDFLESFCATYIDADRAAVRRQVEREDGAWRLAQLVGGEGATIHPNLMEATFRLRLLDHITAEKPVLQSHVIAHKQQLGGNNVVAFRGR
jgi:uncharacterized phage-associated protein